MGEVSIIGITSKEVDMAERNGKAERRVSKTETVIGILILIGLAALGTGVYYRQFQYDNKLFGVDLPAENGSAVKSGEPESGIGKLLRELGGELAGGMEVEMLPVESFTRENVYEKIDGKDQAYLSRGMKTLDVLPVNWKGAAGESFEVFVYDMGEAENAFGIYSAMKTDDPEWNPSAAMPQSSSASHPAAPDSQLTGQKGENAIFFIKGPYYVCLLGSSTSAELMGGMEALGLKLAERLPGQTGRFWVLDVFPEEGRSKEGLGYVKEAFLGTKFLDRVYTMRYKVAKAADGAEPLGYLTRRKDAAEAGRLFDELEKYYRDSGGTDVQTMAAGMCRTLQADFYGMQEFAFVCGEYVGGVTESMERAAAEKIGGAIREAILKKSQEAD